MAEERSPSGGPIYRHRVAPPDAEVAIADEARIVAHVERHLARPAFTFREIESDRVRIDVHVVPPAGERNFTVLVTTGASARPMTVPADLPERELWRHAELCMILPPGWPLAREALEDARIYWPIRLLKVLARLPHEYGTWIGYGHTIPNGDPPEPFAPGTSLACALLTRPFMLGDGFFRVPGDPPLHLFQVIPVTPAEMELKLARGTSALLDRLEELDPDIYGPLDPGRPCAVGWDGSAPVEPALPARRRTPEPDGAWIVVPAAVARTPAALDALLTRAARACRANELRARIAVDPQLGLHTLQVFGAPVATLASAMSFVDKRIAALRLAGDRGCAAVFHDGARTRQAGGTATDAAQLVGDEVAASADQILAMVSAHGARAEVRVVRFERGGPEKADNPNVTWSTDLDEAFETELAAAALAPFAELLVARFTAWRRAHAAYTAFEDADDADVDEDEMAEAERDADVAHLAVVAALRAALPHMGFPAASEALDRVLTARGVPRFRIRAFRAWAP